MAVKTRKKAPLLQAMSDKKAAMEKEKDERLDALELCFDGLTLKQQMFVREYVDTSNGTKSALAAYSTDDYGTAAVMAWENLKNPKIKRAITEYTEIFAGKNYCISKLHRLSGGAKSQDTQLRATVELAKINGLYDNSNNAKKDVNIININLPSLSQTPDNVIDITAG